LQIVLKLAKMFLNTGGLMKKIWILIIGILILASGLVAKSQEIAYVDIDAVITRCNDTQEIQKAFDVERQEWVRQLSDLENEINRMETDFESRKLTYSTSGKAEQQKKIDDKKANYRSKVEEFFGDNGSAARRYQELVEPVQNKILEIIQEIAIQENYSLVLNVSAGGILYATQDMDITEMVIQRMDAQQGTSSTPKPNTSNATPKPNNDNKPVENQDGKK
jgi:outer membrane protein